MDRSISNSASIRRTASSAMGETTDGALPCDFRRALASMSARTKNFPRAWLQHAASVTGPWRAAGFIELAVAAIGVGLQDPGEAREMSLGMLARSVARIIEHRRRRRRAAEGAVVAHIGPTSPNIGFSLGEHGHGSVVAMQPRGGEDMGLQQIENRTQHADAGADLIGERRQAQRHAFPGVTLGLAVQRLMLAELLEHDHRQETGTGPTPRNDMEGRRRLIDAFAVAAREPFAHMLDDLPLAWDHLQRLGDILAELGQTRSAAAGATRRRFGSPPARAADARETVCARDAGG